MQKEEEEVQMEIPPAGMINKNYKCYINALIQLLFLIKPLVWAILNYKNIDDKPIDKATLALREIFINLGSGRRF
jgi:ubiquitin C-terminal hydrolase